MRPSFVLPPLAVKNVIVGALATPLPSTVTPGMAFRMLPYAWVPGRLAITSPVSTTSRLALWTSTTGVSPVTVIVSAIAPTFRSALMVAVNEPVSSTPSRLTVVNPPNVNVIEYVPGRRSTMRYKPAPSVTALFVFSMRTGLAASTVTPGSTAPEASFTTPAIEAWANSAAGTRTTRTNALNHARNVCMSSPFFMAQEARPKALRAFYTLQEWRKQRFYESGRYLCTKGFGTSDAVEIQTLFTCRYSFSISWPLSRPMPDRL